MTANITRFPVKIINRFATEDQSGLCPALCASISDPTSASTSGVVSEYGIRLGIKDKVESLVSGSNLGVGEGVFSEFVYVGDRRPQFRLKSLSTQNRKRITFEISNDTAVVKYDGRPGFDQIYVNNSWVQGGVYQMVGTIGGIADDWDSKVDQTITGYSTEGIPVCANADPVWDTDIAVAKIGIRIPANNGFAVSGQIIGIGTTADPYMLGSFRTATSAQILKTGEWRDFDYSSDMCDKQYTYFETPASIVAYTTGATTVLNGYSSEYSKFDVRVWFDKVDYSGITIYPFDAILMGGFYLESIDIVERYTVSTDSWTTLASLPGNRRDAAGFSIDGVTYLVGGGPGGTSFNNAKRLDSYYSVTNVWQLVNKTIPVGRSFLGALSIPGTTTAIVGPGFGVNRLDSFDSSTAAWTSKTKAPVGNYGAAYAYSNGYCWMYGGSPGTSDSNSKANQRYDSVTNAWSSKSDLPAAHDGPYGAGCSIAGKNYFFGSRGSNLNHEYDATTDVWTERLAMHGDKTRRHHGSLSLYSKGFVFGGRLTKSYVDSNGITQPRYSGTYTDLCEYFNSYTNTWTTKQYLTSPRELDNSLSTI